MNSRGIFLLFGPAVVLLVLFGLGNIFKGDSKSSYRGIDRPLPSLPKVRYGTNDSRNGNSSNVDGEASLSIATEIRVIDGDTIEWRQENFRLSGFDTPETMHAKCPAEKLHGQAATEALRALIAGGEKIELKILKGKDKYNRGLAKLTIGNREVSDELIRRGLARPYSGGKRQSWCDE